jgi:PAS domain S-box-containing protein
VSDRVARQDPYYESLLQTSPSAILTVDLNDTVTAWNPAAERLFGYTRKEAVGRNVESLIAYREDLRREGAEWNRRVRAGEDMQRITRRLRKDGTLVDVHVVASVIRVDGKPVAYYAIYTDIGEPQRQRRYYESLLETSPSAIAIVDMDGIITSWNPAAERLFGYTRDEAMGRNLDSMFVGREDLRSEVLEVSEQARQGGEVHLVTRRARKDGSLVDVNVVASAIFVEGEAVGYYAIYSDIGELQRQRRYYESLLEKSPTAIITLALDGTITSWNPAAEELFGFERDEVLGKTLDPLVASDPMMLDEANDVSGRTASGEAVRVVTTRARKDGTLIDVDIVSAPIFVSGEQVGYYGIYTDIGDLQERTRELQVALKQLADKSLELEKASRHKSEFLANMSHELRTPLNAIVGFSQVLKQKLFGEVNDKQEEYLDDILSSADHLLDLINDILDLSKVEAGQVELESGLFSLREALERGVVMVRERASKNGVSLELTLDPNVDLVEGDERRIRQVVFNLLSNAVKFTPQGGRVDVSTARVDGEVLVAVRDTGPGIALADQARIFEEFQQANSGNGERPEGTGLGLALSKSLVELHGGRIWVESEPGRGSTFTFTIPVGSAQ